MKLNGWQRIGIVASVVWVIYSYNHTYDDLIYRQSSINVEEELNCMRAHQGDDSAFRICDAVGKDNGGMANRLKEQHDDSIAAITEAIIPVPLAWGFVYLTLFLVRWVKRGFAKSQ